MTLGLLLFFFGLHLVLIAASVLVSWLSGATTTLVDALAASTPVSALVGDDSSFGEGSLYELTFKNSLNVGFNSIQAFYGLFSFNYPWLHSDGPAGIFGILLQVMGHLVAGWFLFQIFKAGVGGFFSFLGR